MKSQNKIWFLTIRLFLEKALDVTIVYKSPKVKSNEFFEFLDSYINENLSYNNNNMIVGDMNINVKTKTKVVKEYYNMLSGHGFKQLVNEPTRPNVKNLNASSIIDHLFSNNNSINYNIDRSDKISDHYIIMINYNSSSYTMPVSKNCNMIKGYKKQEFLDKVMQRITHNNIGFHEMYEELKFVMKTFVTRVNIAKKRHTYSKKIADLKKNKCSAYNKFINSSDVNDLKIHDELNKKYKKEIKSHKVNEIQEKLTKFRHDPKRLWSTLKNLYKPSNNDIKAIIFDNIVVDNPIKLRNKLNKFFVESVHELVTSIEKSKNNDYNNKIEKPNEQFDLVTIDKKQLKKYVELIKSKNFDDFVYGENILDLISNDQLADTFLRSINKLIIENEMPQSLKISIISPIPKVDNPKVPEDYRPINNLPVLEKLIETIVLDQLNEFLEVNKIISDAQHGFRAKHSTETALIALTDNIVQNFEKNKIVLTIFLDFKRAFETINRKILIDKLQKYNFGNDTIKWFESFLSQRKQVVKINGEYSDEIDVELGVPQGSKLANMLFILYVNDLVNHLKDCDIIMYADDTSISVSGSTTEEVIDKMNNILKIVSDWLKFNRIALNKNKCKYIIFSNRQKKNLVKNVDIVIDDTIIENVDQIKYLGVIVDEKLDFSKNSELVIKKLNKKLGFIRRQGFKMNEASRVLYYKSIVQPHLDYCSFLIHMSCKSQIDKMQKIQNKFLRAIKLKKEMSNHDLVRKELNICNVYVRINVNILKSLNRINTNKMPNELIKRIKIVSNKTRHNLRQGTEFNVPKYYTKVGKKSFFYYGKNLMNQANRYISKNKLQNNNIINNYCKFLNEV
jgi:hypothetical protein